MGERREPKPGCKVFVGDLKPDTQERDVEEAFAKFGQLKNCFVARAPGGFGFVEFEDAQDATEAVKALDGTVINGSTIRTEISHGRKNENKKMTWDRDRDYERKSYYSSGSDYGRRPRGYSPPRRSGSGYSSSSSESEIRRLRDENARLRIELDQLKGIIASGKY